LMVDIKNVNGVFLNSEHLLSRAMVDVVNEAELTLLSYHCHGLTPAGVSCVGILLHNYISFHTWPVEGVITFDLCSAGSKSILPVLPIIERLFGVPRIPSHPGQVVESPEYRWAHKMRGFRHHPTRSSHLFLGTDLGAIVLRILGTEYKEEVSQQTVLMPLLLFAHSTPLVAHVTLLPRFRLPPSKRTSSGSISMIQYTRNTEASKVTESRLKTTAPTSRVILSCFGLNAR
jgi:hypothetical protein